MIQFHRLNIGNNATESRAVGKIAIVEKQPAFIQPLIAPKMLYPGSQQIAGTPHNSVHRVSLFQKQLAQVGAVLTGDPGNQRDFVGLLHVSQIFVRN
jgi:hypothetical protein